MKQKILAAFAALCMAFGMAAAFAPMASATPNPPLNTLAQTGDVGGYLHPCYLYFAQGNSGGRAYAKIKKIRTSDCSMWSDNYQCPVDYDPPAHNSDCRYEVRISYLYGGVSYGAWAVLPTYFPADWIIAQGPVGSTLQSSQVYAVNNGLILGCGGSFASCDPLIADTQGGITDLVTLRRFYQGQ